MSNEAHHQGTQLDPLTKAEQEDGVPESDALLPGLAHLAQLFNNGEAISSTTVQEIASVGRLLLEASACALIIIDAPAAQLVVGVANFSTESSAVSVSTVPVEPGALSLPSSVLHDYMPRIELAAQRTQPFASVPIVSAGEQVGLLVCYGSALDAAKRQLVLEVIANQVALAVQKNRLNSLFEKEVSLLVGDFVTRLVEVGQDSETLQQQARILGFNFSNPHTVALIDLIKERGKDSKTITSHMEKVGYLSDCVRYQLQEHVIGSLILRQENRLVCLIPLELQTEADLKGWLRELVHALQRQQGLRMFVGIGAPCRSISDYRRGYDKAQEALTKGLILHPEGGVIDYNEMGVMRFIDIQYLKPNTASFTPEFQKFTQIAASRNGKQLMNTLDVFLNSAGDVGRTSQALKIHYNTVKQRIDHLSSILGFDIIQKPDRWPTLVVAMMLFKLQQGR